MFSFSKKVRWRRGERKKAITKYRLLETSSNRSNSWLVQMACKANNDAASSQYLPSNWITPKLLLGNGMGIRPLGGLSYTKGSIFRRHDAAEYKQKEELEFCCV